MDKILLKQPVSFQKGWESFYLTSIDKIGKKLSKLPPETFEVVGRRATFNLFREMARRVPAYKDFLKKNKIKAEKIRNFRDLKYVPWVDKENYIKKYSLTELSWDGKIDSSIISASSGSTGQPFYWPRSTLIEMETNYIYELFLKHVFNIDRYKTLLISGFSMGVYVGGTFTLNCCMRLKQKGYPLTIITPGINQDEILRIVEQLSHNFQQIILGGYPPFIRDILDEGEKRGISWKKKRIRFIFASENLSEQFRAYLYAKAGIKKEEYFSASLNLYGTADAAIVGHEMPLGTFMRKLFSRSYRRCEEFFHRTYVPSLNQYYPFFKYLETEGEEIILSSPHNGVPLLKYNIHDKGKLISYREMIDTIKSFGYKTRDIEKIVGKNLLWHLPYVYLYGRSDFTVTIYGLNIYPENIKAAIETKELRDFCTGKFVMETSNRKKDQSQYLLIHIELRIGRKGSRMIKKRQLKKSFREVITNVLRKRNSEYNHLYQSIGSRAKPEINLHLKGDPDYFPPATKQSWIKRK